MSKQLTEFVLLFSDLNGRASMIWIIGEYAERIDNADELLESFLDGFQDENTQVCSHRHRSFSFFCLYFDFKCSDFLHNVLGNTESGRQAQQVMFEINMAQKIGNNRR